MKQFSTGTGLVALSIGMVAASFIATHHSGATAYAQVTGGDRRIVSQGVYSGNYPTNSHWAYRIWSDNVTEVKLLGMPKTAIDQSTCRANIYLNMQASVSGCGLADWTSTWQVVDVGSPTFMPTDIDRSGQVDSADIAQVLLDFNETVDQTTPPPIDCNINALR